MTQNSQFCLQLFQSFPIKVDQNDLEWPISLDSQLFQFFPTEDAQNDSEQPILLNLQLFKSFPTKAAQNDWEILPDSQLFQCKKGPLSHQRMKCSFLDDIQLLMIGQVI